VISLLQTSATLPVRGIPLATCRKTKELSGPTTLQRMRTMQHGNEALEDSGSWAEEAWEEDCGGCSSIRVQLGAMNANRAFELETLSQHRFLIGKLQDESEAQRSQIEDNRLKMEMLQRRLEQLEGTQAPPSNPGEQQGNSRHAHSNSVNQIPDLNEPHPENMEDMQHIKTEKGN
jgi:hypothetical protein